MMLSFSVSLWFFNRGHIFAAMPLVYPGLVWLLARCFWVGKKDRAPRGSTVWPVWLLIGATVFLGGFRIGLNWRNSNVIDVGYSGVIGAQRIADGVRPVRQLPDRGRPARLRARRLERRDPRPHPDERPLRVGGRAGRHLRAGLLRGLPAGVLGVRLEREVWDTLPAAHATSILWDLLCLVGLWLVGLRFGGHATRPPRSAFAWVAWPFSQYSSSSNTNDMIQPALLLFGFYFLSRAGVTRRLRDARGAREVLAADRAAALVGLPGRARPPLAAPRSSLGALVAAAAAFSILLLDSRPLHAAPVFFHHTFGYQFGRVVAVLALGLGPVPREGPARPPLAPARPPGGARRRRARALPLAAPPLAAADRRVHGRAARSASSWC